MDINKFHIKLPKETVRTKCGINDKKNNILIYLYFHMTSEYMVYTSVDCICSELNLSTKSHGQRRSQNIVKEILNELKEDGIILFVPFNDGTTIDNLKNNQLFKLQINVQSPILNPKTNYVKIDITEYQEIMRSKDTICKTMNVYCQIKSYICMDDSCLKICYPSIKTLCNLCGCSDNTLFKALKILYNQKLIYIYRFNDQEKEALNSKVEYVFSLEKYTKDQIYREFAG